MPDTTRIPFTEIFERMQKELLRDASASEGRYKGAVNNFYTIDLPSQIDYRHIRKTGQLTTVADVTTGYITAISSTTVTGDSDALWTSANSNTLQLKVSGYDELYRMTYVSGTSLTLDRTWIGDAIVATDTEYTLFQDRYTLASDFDRMILDPDKSVYYYENGSKIYLIYSSIEDFEKNQVFTPSDPNEYTIKWVNGSPYLYINSPDTQARTLEYVYIPMLSRMKEYTTGTITTLANAGTAVTGDSTDFDGFVSDTTNYDYYFRIDGDGTGASSIWYKISSATNDTALVLSDSYEGTAISGGTSTFTISTVSLLPPGLDLAILYGSAIEGAIDQESKQVANWAALYNRITSQYKAIEGKKDYGKKRMMGARR